MGLGAVERARRAVTPGDWPGYEALLQALAEGEVWMLLWRGTPGSPDTQYGNMEIGGYGYAPAVTSAEQLAASGWTRSHEVVSGARIADALYRTRWGLWLDPHAPGGGVGIPWADLRRIAVGLDRLPAGPLRLSRPRLSAEQFYAALQQQAVGVPQLRELREAWVQPVLGEPHLAIGLELDDTSPASITTAREAVQRAAAHAPEGLAVSVVVMADEFDPVAMWLRAEARPIFDRTAVANPPVPGYRTRAVGPAERPGAGSGTR